MGMDLAFRRLYDWALDDHPFQPFEPLECLVKLAINKAV